MINMSQVQYPNDRVDITGTEHPTVGENIRNGSKKLTFNSQTERDEAYTALNMSPRELKTFIRAMFTGRSGNWGGSSVPGFNDIEKQAMKNWLNS